MNLMLRLFSTSQIDVLALGLGQLGRALERVVDAARRRAVVAVEARRDAVVAVEVHAPGVAAGRIGVGVRAVVGHVPALGGEVVEAVVRAVRVVGRDQEDVGVVDDVLGRGVGRVVAHEPLGGLDRDRDRHPLAGVVVRLDQHARLGAVAVLADPQRADGERAARDLARGRAGALLVEEVGEDDRGRRRRARCPCPRWCGTGARGRSGPASPPRSRPRPAPRCWRARRSRSWPAGRATALVVDLDRQRQVRSPPG